MKNEDYEIISKVHHALGKECPNCGGEMRQFRDWKLRCNVCGLDIKIVTRKDRLFVWVFYGSVMVFAFGFLVATLL